jgi:hypothetical protein
MFSDRQWFIENRDKLRKLAPLKGMCTRCTVRLARQGKKYCQRCTDYAKRYARHSKHKEIWGKEPTRGFASYRHKAMRAADYRLADDPGELIPHLPTQRSQSFVSEPVSDALPHRRDELFADFNRARASGAAIILQNPIPVPLGLNPLYDEIEGL